MKRASEREAITTFSGYRVLLPELPPCMEVVTEPTTGMSVIVEERCDLSAATVTMKVTWFL